MTFRRPLLWHSFMLAAAMSYAPAMAQTTPPTPIPALNLMSQERNFPTLNTRNLTETQSYIVPAPSAAATQFQFQLKGYVFGLRMIRANYTGYIDGGRYAAYTDLKTSGLGALLKKLEIWAVTRGQVTASGLRPDWHVQQNMDGKERRVEMNYNTPARRVDVNIIPTLGSQGVPPASPTERYAAMDTISAVLSMMISGTYGPGDVCTGAVPIFDSKQHYRLRLERDGTKRVKYQGDKVEALRCLAYYEPVSGFDPEDLPDAEEESTPVKVYFVQDARLNMWVPTRFTYKISAIKAVIKLDEMAMVTPG